MAFRDSAGNGFTNHSDMKRSEMKMKAKAPAQKPAVADDEGAEQDGAAMAQQHGPAASIDIQHGQTHTVHVTHPDGHTHESQHASAAAAHKYAADCAGGGMEAM